MRLALAALALLSSSALVQAQTFTWNAGAGNYSTAGNWTPSGPPTSGSNVVINNGGTVNYASGTATPSSITLGSTVGGSGALAMTGGAINLNASTLRIGEQGTGLVTLNNATLTTINDQSIFVGGQNDAGTGTLTVSGNASVLTSGDDLGIGRIGTGTFNMQGGLAVADYVTIGKFGEGVFNLSGGLFRQASGDFEVGDGGTPGQEATAGPRSGMLNITGGVLQGSGFFAVSNRRATGEVNISGGALAVTGAVNNGAILVGRGADWGGSPLTGGPTSFRVTGDDSIIIANGAFEMNKNNVATSSTLIAEITGSAHTTIKVAGNADIGNGTFKVELNGYTPVSGDSWTILSAGVTDFAAEEAAIDARLAAQQQPALSHVDPIFFGTLNGTFKETDFSLAQLSAGLLWDIAYANNSVVLSVVGTGPAFSADFNNDGRVDGDDLNVWKTEFGKPAPSGADANDDGLSDGADFLEWQRQFGSGVPATPAVGAVPEPASVAILSMAALGMAAYARGCRSAPK
jgi:T5SS/PEP-CTERM-associated repeat protein